MPVTTIPLEQSTVSLLLGVFRYVALAADGFFEHLVLQISFQKQKVKPPDKN